MSLQRYPLRQLVDTVQIIRRIREIYADDPNFRGPALTRIDEFLDNPDVIDRPEKNIDIIHEMKMEAILATENSPYAEVRSCVEPTDDPTLPVLTIRVWVIGCIFAGAGSFIDAFFLMRNPPVYIGANVAQLLACKWPGSYSQQVYAKSLLQILAVASWNECCPTTGSDSLAESTA